MVQRGNARPSPSGRAVRQRVGRARVDGPGEGRLAEVRAPDLRAKVARGLTSNKDGAGSSTEHTGGVEIAQGLRDGARSTTARG